MAGSWGDRSLGEGEGADHALFRGVVSAFAYLEHYRALARTRGCEVGCEYAVTFAVPPESRCRREQRLTK